MKTQLPCFRLNSVSPVSKRKWDRILTLLFILQVISAAAFAQSGSIAGKVSDAQGAPLIGVSVGIKNTQKGTTTDADGSFIITNVEEGAYSLLISYIGYLNREIPVTVLKGQQANANATLTEDTRNLDEVVVTGVADARTRMESSVAISTLSSKQIELQAPVSSADVLKNVPGVFVNSALGEIRNVVYSRGVSAGSVEAATGYYYVSLQEDGLPVTNITFSNYGPDYFYRTDATLKRLEAVRGGTASIFGANAPGGIFNYVSKTGQDAFAGEYRAKIGMEGNGSYYRNDLNFGGALAKDIYYNVGGFYRYSNGARNAGYPMNNGGQLKGNLVKNFENGSVKFFAKYLNDKNGWFEFLPVKNFNDPSPAPGVTQTTSYLPPAGKTTVPSGSLTESKSFDPSNLTNSTEISIGNEMDFDLGNSWSFRNSGKFSRKNIDWNSTAQAYPLGLDNSNLHDLFGTRGIYGTYTFTRPGSNEPIATLVTRPAGSAAGPAFEVTSNNLPGQDVLKNGVVTQLGLIQQFEVSEVMDQFMVSKKFNNMTFTGGGFYGNSTLSYLNQRAGVGLTTIENQPDLLDVTLTRPNGSVVKITNNEGWGNLGGQGNFQSHTMNQSQLAGFFGHDWTINEKINFDWGVRYEHINVNGVLTSAGRNAAAKADNLNKPTFGGVDKDTTTLYDNLFSAEGPRRSFDKSINTLSYSGGFNYKINNKSAVYARYSRGKKAPDLAYYMNTYSIVADNVKNKAFDPTAQTINQMEVGYKLQTKGLNVFATPFFSLLSDIYSPVSLVDADGSSYVADPILNKIRTYGLELEADYTIFDHLNLRAVATIQSSVATDWGTLISTKNGREDDIVDYSYSGNKADNTPNLMLNVTPTYTTDKYYAFLGWKYMGSRPANVPNTFELPAFSQFDLGLGYNFTKRFTLSANVNNLLGSEGVMSWGAPGGFPRAGNRQGYIPSEMQKDIDAAAANGTTPTFFAIMVQPRSYFLTASYKF
jgi:iron complex outermembrane receptor protein